MVVTTLRRVVGACALLALLAPFAEAQELYLTSRPVVGSEARTISDLCLPGAGTASTAAFLSAPLPPLSSEPSVIPARDIRTILAPALGGSVVLVGGPVVYVPNSVVDQAGIRFYSALLEYIASRLPDVHVEASATAGQQPDLTGIQGNLEFRLPAGVDTPRSLINNTYIEYRGSLDRQWRYLPIHFRAFVLAPVARQRLAYGEPFTRAQIAYAEVDVRSLGGSPANLAGGRFQASAAIAAGAPIFADMVKVVYDVRSGERLHIQFRRGSIRVTVPGIAYQAGSVGDRISVSTLDGSRRFTGTIVTPTEVVVED